MDLKRCWLLAVLWLAIDPGMFAHHSIAAEYEAKVILLNAVITRSVPVLDAAALECARRYRFEPYRHRGHPARVWVPLSIRFLL